MRRGEAARSDAADAATRGTRRRTATADDANSRVCECEESARRGPPQTRPLLLTLAPHTTHPSRSRALPSLSLPPHSAAVHGRRAPACPSRTRRPPRRRRRRRRPRLRVRAPTRGPRPDATSDSSWSTARCSSFVSASLGGTAAAGTAAAAGAAAPAAAGWRSETALAGSSGACAVRLCICARATRAAAAEPTTTSPAARAFLALDRRAAQQRVGHRRRLHALALGRRARRRRRRELEARLTQRP